MRVGDCLTFGRNVGRRSGEIEGLSFYAAVVDIVNVIEGDGVN